MIDVSEFRVRPVNRFVLTHYQSSDRCGSVRTIGEFPNAEAANEVAAAMRATVKQQPADLKGGIYPVSYPLPPSEPAGIVYVIVGDSMGDESAIVHYAYSEREAAESRAHCEAKFGGEFKVYERNK